MNKLYARRDRGMWQVDRRTRGQGNMLLVVEDRVTDEQVRGVTERGEWAADGRGVGWGRKESGLRTEGEWDGDGKRAGCGQKGSGMGAEGVWAENGRGVGWVWTRRGREMGGRMEGM